MIYFKPAARQATMLRLPPTPKRTMPAIKGPLAKPYSRRPTVPTMVRTIAAIRQSVPITPVPIRKPIR